MINCDTQEEIDYYWEKLTAGGGEEVECGWVADKYGLSWQVTPAKFFAEWVKDPAGLQRVTHEVWQMRKLDLAKLQKAFAGKWTRPSVSTANYSAVPSIRSTRWTVVR